MSVSRQILQSAMALGLFMSASFGTIITMSAGQAKAAKPEAVTLTGELIDSFCYLSGVMGGPEAVVGTAHHKCALWCAAGGIPVGLLSEDGTVYMILQVEGDSSAAPPPSLFPKMSHKVTVDGEVYRRDGINYIIIRNLSSDAGIVNMTHEDFGVVPPFALPAE